MNNYDSSSAATGIMAFLGIMLIVGFVIMVIMIIAYWKIYTKADKPGWAAIIPIYNIIVLLEIVGKPVWWIILFIIPGVNLIFIIWTINLLSKSFGQSEGFTIGLLLLGIVFYPVLAFGKYKYIGPAAAEAKGKWTPPPSTFPPTNYQEPGTAPQL